MTVSLNSWGFNKSSAGQLKTQQLEWLSWLYNATIREFIFFGCVPQNISLSPKMSQKKNKIRSVWKLIGSREVWQKQRLCSMFFFFLSCITKLNLSRNNYFPVNIIIEFGVFKWSLCNVCLSLQCSVTRLVWRRRCFLFRNCPSSNSVILKSLNVLSFSFLTSLQKPFRMCGRLQWQLIRQCCGCNFLFLSYWALVKIQYLKWWKMQP